MSEPGFNKMAEACPGTSIAQLSWLSAWHIRDETYSKALARVVNYQHRQPFAAHWGEGTTSSSTANGSGLVVVVSKPGRLIFVMAQSRECSFYAHVSDQYAPFHTKVINATVRYFRPTASRR
jgi:TnpA family transposase